MSRDQPLKQEIDLGYEPRAFQQQFHYGVDGKPYGLLICARQHGKTELAVMELLERAFNRKQHDCVGYVAPYASQTRRVFWRRLKKVLAPLGKQVDYRETDMTATLPNGVMVMGFGADNDAARGVSLSDLIIDEYDSMNEDLFKEVFLPTTGSYEDPFLLYIGTLKPYGRLWKLYEERKDDPDWYCQVTRASEAGVLSPKRLERYRIEMGKSAFLREFECDPAAPVQHSVIGEQVADAQIEGRVKKLAVSSMDEVRSAWDLGIRDIMCTWDFQIVGNWVLILKFREFYGVGVADVIRQKRDDYRLWGDIILPHDIKQRDVMTGVSRFDTFIDMKFGYPVAFPRIPVADGLNATRLVLPRCVFDPEGCALGLQRLKSARYKKDPRTGVLTDQVLHDDNSHALDAFRVMCSYIESRWPSSHLWEDKKEPSVKRALGGRA